MTAQGSLASLPLPQRVARAAVMLRPAQPARELPRMTLPREDDVPAPRYRSAPRTRLLVADLLARG